MRKLIGAVCVCVCAALGWYGFAAASDSSLMQESQTAKREPTLKETKAWIFDKLEAYNLEHIDTDCRRCFAVKLKFPDDDVMWIRVRINEKDSDGEVDSWEKSEYSVKIHDLDDVEVTRPDSVLGAHFIKLRCRQSDCIFKKREDARRFNGRDRYRDTDSYNVSSIFFPLPIGEPGPRMKRAFEHLIKRSGGGGAVRGDLFD